MRRFLIASTAFATAAAVAAGSWGAAAAAAAALLLLLGVLIGSVENSAGGASLPSVMPLPPVACGVEPICAKG